MDQHIDKNESYKGCIMLSLKANYDGILKRIPSSDLGSSGIEDDPHVTLIYGINHRQYDSLEVMKWIYELKIPPALIVKPKLSLFSNDEDVLKMDVKLTLPLSKMRSSVLEQFDNVQQHEDYHPHITIAYLKKGKGQKYVDDIVVDNLLLKISHITYSDPHLKLKYIKKA